MKAKIVYNISTSRPYYCTDDVAWEEELTPEEAELYERGELDALQHVLDRAERKIIEEEAANMEDLVEELEMYEVDEEDEDDEAPTLEDLFRDNYDLNIRFE